MLICFKLLICDTKINDIYNDVNHDGDNDNNDNNINYNNPSVFI